MIDVSKLWLPHNLQVEVSFSSSSLSLTLSIGITYVLSFGSFESTVFGRKLRNRMNETVKSLTFRDIVGANTGFNLLDLICFLGLVAIQ